MQLVYDLTHRAVDTGRVRSSRRPRDCTSTTRAEAGDARLHETPLHREVTDARLQNDRRLRWSRSTGAIEVQAPAADINKPARCSAWRALRLQFALRERGTKNTDTMKSSNYVPGERRCGEDDTAQLFSNAFSTTFATRACVTGDQTASCSRFVDARGTPVVFRCAIA